MIFDVLRVCFVTRFERNYLFCMANIAASTTNRDVNLQLITVESLKYRCFICAAYSSRMSLYPDRSSVAGFRWSWGCWQQWLTGKTTLFIAVVEDRCASISSSILLIPLPAVVSWAVRWSSLRLKDRSCSDCWLPSFNVINYQKGKLRSFLTEHYHFNARMGTMMKVLFNSQHVAISKWRKRQLAHPKVCCSRRAWRNG